MTHKLFLNLFSVSFHNLFAPNFLKQGQDRSEKLAGMAVGKHAKVSKIGKIMMPNPGGVGARSEQSHSP